MTSESTSWVGAPSVSVAPELRSFTQVQVPGRIVHGAGSLDLLSREIAVLGCGRPLLVTSPTVAKGPLANAVRSAAGVTDAPLFGGAALHVPMASVLELADVIRSYRPDVLVAFGGGSALDTAKGAALAASVSGDFRTLHRDFMGNAACVGHEELPKVITIPSTLTGAERTGAFSIVEGARKLNYTEVHTRASVVIQDPDVVRLTPRRVLMESGMNSMAHSIEALLSGTVTPLTRPLYLQALRLHSRYLPVALRSPDDAEASGALLAASALAMAVGAQNLDGRSGIIHALTHAITGASGAPHGAVYGVVIPEGIRFNAERSPGASEEICEAIVGTVGDTAMAVDAFVELRSRLGLPARLREMGISRASFERTAELTMLHFATAQNVRPIESATVVVAMLDRLY